MGNGRILKQVAAVRYAQAEDTYILNQMDEKRVKYVHVPVAIITAIKLTRHFRVERSPSVPSWGK